ncbi:MAG: class I mannose-6-phosphate isomerase [Opitutaceae bacterium]|nr:class I mannose-6-phosphate isomerase [Opitutaceae bacterium]
MTHRGKIVLLPPNRVWRSYTGGRTLDQLAGAPAPADRHFPEDWIASTTRAINAGRETITEGPSRVVVGGAEHDFAALLASDPDYFLGSGHAARHGAQPHVLVKLLDPAIRLHLQVHPSAAFARERMQAPSGKTEAYHILGVRPEVRDPAIFLGFREPPTREGLRDLIERQDIAALLALMNRVPVKPGDTYVVPGGLPHALGEGLFLVEVQEPSDLVVRFEFERGGHVLPESARFMQRGLEFCLDVFDRSAWSPGRVLVEAGCPPRRRRALGPDSWQDDLIGPERTPCFRVRHSTLHAAVQKAESSAHIAIVTTGACSVRAGGETHRFAAGGKFFLPAGIGAVGIEPEPACTVLECYPPDAT